MIELIESRIFDFEEFRFDAKSHRLFRRETGEIVSLTRKTSEVLLYFIENAGQVLSKDQILDMVWENSFVEEANLSQTIFVLRKTLGEDTKNPRFILTIPNRGYQFVAEVKQYRPEDEILEESFLSNSQVQSPKPEVQSPNPQSEIRSPKLAWLFAPLVLLIAVGVYWFYPKSKAVGLSEIKTIAILPFEDLSAEQSDKYLGVSLADALGNKFSELKKITVRPTRSVLKYAESREDLGKIGRELQVDAVLDGRISHVGERIRISVQLVRTSDSATIWTGNFDDQFTNFFAIQDSISQKVVQSLALQMNDKERERFNRRGTENAEAYQDYLRGRYFWNKRTRENLLKAVTYFEQATQKDPNFALAFTGIANCYQLLPEYYGATTLEAFPKAKAAVNRALELDDQSAEAFTALAHIQAFYDWNFAEADKSFKRALELNPNYATAHQWYSELLYGIGKIDESDKHTRRALEIDPTSPILMTNLAASYYYVGKFDQAIEYSKKVLELDPNFAFGYFYLGFSYEHLGNYAEASEGLAKTMTLNGEPPECATEVREAFMKNGMKGWWEKRREQFENRPHLKFAPAFSYAVVYAKVGDKERALQWLNKSFEQRERWMVGLKYAIDLNPLHDDPRFQDLLRRMSF